MTRAGETNRPPLVDRLLRAMSHAAGLAVALVAPVWIEAALRPSPNGLEGPVMAALLALFVAPLAAVGFLVGARLAGPTSAAVGRVRHLGGCALTGVVSAVLLYGIVGVAKDVVGVDLLYLLCTPVLGVLAARIAAAASARVS